MCHRAVRNILQCMRDLDLQFRINIARAVYVRAVGHINRDSGMGIKMSNLYTHICIGKNGTTKLVSSLLKRFLAGTI